MANPYGMVMGLDGRWEYDPRAFTNAQFRAAPSRFPYMGVGSLGAGLMTHSPLAGLGSDLTGMDPGYGLESIVDPTWAAPSFSTGAVSGVGPVGSSIGQYGVDDQGNMVTSTRGRGPRGMGAAVGATPTTQASGGVPHAVDAVLGRMPLGLGQFYKSEPETVYDDTY